MALWPGSTPFFLSSVSGGIVSAPDKTFDPIVTIGISGTFSEAFSFTSSSGKRLGTGVTMGTAGASSGVSFFGGGGVSFRGFVSTGI